MNLWSERAELLWWLLELLVFSKLINLLVVQCVWQWRAFVSGVTTLRDIWFSRKNVILREIVVGCC